MTHQVASFCDIEALLELSCCNRRLFQILSSYEWLWKAVFENHFLSLSRLRDAPVADRQAAEVRLTIIILLFFMSVVGRLTCRSFFSDSLFSTSCLCPCADFFSGTRLV
jgi:hypothetical protein